MAEGKHIYRQACDENKIWNVEVSVHLKERWLKWTKQLNSVQVPRNVITSVREIAAVHLHLFVDASNLACCAAAIAEVEHDAGVIKGLLTSKSRISKRSTTTPRLELISGHMAANMVRTCLLLSIDGLLSPPLCGWTVRLLCIGKSIPGRDRKCLWPTE